MIWYSMYTPPQKDGTYYVRHITNVVSSDLREYGAEPYWEIRTHSFTVSGGWNTHIGYDGKVNDKNRMTLDGTDEWSEVQYVDR